MSVQPKKANTANVAPATNRRPRRPVQYGVDYGQNDPGVQFANWLGSLFNPKGKPGQNPEGRPAIPKAPPTGATIEGARPGITQQATSEEQQRLDEGNRMSGLAEGMGAEATQDTEQATTSYDQTLNANYAQHQQNQAAVQDQQQKLEAMPGQVQEVVQTAKQDFQTFAQEGLGQVTARADQAIADVAKGQGYALQAATQGIQGNIQAQVNAISSDPNIPPAQKAQLINQVKVQGAMALGPAVGSTILEFNKLQAETAVQMNSQITSAINQATSSYGALSQQGMQVEAGALEAARTIGATLTQMSINDNNQYIQNKTAINAARFQAEMTNNQFQLALLPERERPIPMFSTVMMDDLNMQVSAMREEFMLLSQQYGMQMGEMMAQRATWDSRFNLLSSAFGMIPGPVGMIGAAGAGLVGAFGQPTFQPATTVGGSVYS